MKIEALNEDGSIRPASGDSCFEFSYGNPFSGSCRFTARVVTGEEKGLFVEPESIRWLEFRPRAGRERLLSTHALTFFRHFLSRKDSLKQFESKIRPSYLHNLWQKWTLGWKPTEHSGDSESEMASSRPGDREVDSRSSIACEPEVRSIDANGMGPASGRSSDSSGNMDSENHRPQRASASIEPWTERLHNSERPQDGAKRTAAPVASPSENLPLPFPEVVSKNQS